MQIRVLTPGDYDELIRMWDRTPGVGLRTLDDSREGIERYLLRNPSTSFAAVEDGRMVGAILCGHDGRRGYLYHTAVLPDFRRRGIGAALTGAAIAALRDEGIHKAALVVFCDNRGGDAFWERLGFDERTDLRYRNKSLNENNR